jgi:hypothetical protein
MAKWSTQYEDGLTRLLDCAEGGYTSCIADDAALFKALGSISNTEMFISAASSRIVGLGPQKLRACIEALAKLESRYGDEGNSSWYFVNTFAQIFSMYRALSGGELPREVLALLLSDRRNKRMPFGKPIDLNVRTLDEYDAFVCQQNVRRTRHTAKMDAQTEAKKVRDLIKASAHIWKAIARNDMKGVAGLLAKGADVNAISEEGMTLEQYAIDCGNAEIAELIHNKKKN